MRSACVPLPTPGAPTKITLAALLRATPAAAVILYQSVSWGGQTGTATVNRVLGLRVEVEAEAARRKSDDNGHGVPEVRERAPERLAAVGGHDARVYGVCRD